LPVILTPEALLKITEAQIRQIIRNELNLSEATQGSISTAAQAAAGTFFEALGVDDPVIVGELRPEIITYLGRIGSLAMSAASFQPWEGVGKLRLTLEQLRHTIREVAGSALGSELRDAGLSAAETERIEEYLDGRRDGVEFYDDPLFKKLFKHYTHETDEMPYDIAKGRSGDPDMWILDHLDSLYHGVR